MGGATDSIRYADHDTALAFPVDHDPRADWVHSCLPSMGYACGGSIVGLADGGPGGHQVFGASERDWPTITCPECRAVGRREISRLCHRQQRPIEHVCPPAGDANDASCAHWQSIPEAAA